MQESHNFLPTSSPSTGSKHEIIVMLKFHTFALKLQPIFKLTGETSALVFAEEERTMPRNLRSSSKAADVSADPGAKSETSRPRDEEI